MLVLVVLVLRVSPFVRTPVLIFLGFGEEGSAVWLVPSESLDPESYSVKDADADADADTHANLDLSVLLLLDSFLTLKFRMLVSCSFL